MVKSITFFALTFLAASSPSFGLQLINVSKVFSTVVSTPFIGTFCQNRLWVYSKENQNFSLLALNDGHMIHEFDPLSLESGASVTAVSCYRQNIAVAILRSPRKAMSEIQFYEIDDKVQLARVKTVRAPGKGRINDLLCRSTKCSVLVESELYETPDFLHWIKVKIPESTSLSRKDIDLKSNPFDNWYDSHILAHGHYTKFTYFGESLLLLDPFRASIVTVKGSSAEKWGSWGVWEGRLSLPKALAALPYGDLVISDTRLKALFIFNSDGTYRGTLGFKSKILEPSYGLTLLSQENRIFIFDFIGNSVSAYDLPSHFNLPNTNVTDVTNDYDNFVRSNLFRREQVLNDRIKLRCLTCHDGAVTDELDKYIKSKITHPVNIAFNKPTRLALEGENWITCSTCHDAHHGTDVVDGDKKTSSPVERPFLRKEFRPLCLECHEDHATSEHNHPDPKGETCTKCHKIHGASEHLLTRPSGELCLSCHKNKAFPHRSVADLTGTHQAKGLILEGEKISCLTCHAPHNSDAGQNKILRPASEVVPFCSSCHGEMSEQLYKSGHKRMHGKKGL